MSISDIFLQDDHRRSFEEHGFARVRLLGSDTCRQLINAYRALVARDPDGFSTTFGSGQPGFKHAVREQIWGAFMPELRKVVHGVEPLIGSYLCKMPGPGGTVDLHQDWSFTNEPEFNSVHVWCPLVRTDTQNGCLCVVSGSHRLPLIPRETPRSEAPYAPFREQLLKHLTPVPTEAGEAIIYQSNLLHYSAPNSGTEPRYVGSVLLIEKGATPVLFFREPDGRTGMYATSADHFCAPGLPTRPGADQRLALLTLPKVADAWTELRKILKGPAGDSNGAPTA